MARQTRSSEVSPLVEVQNILEEYWVDERLNPSEGMGSHDWVVYSMLKMIGVLRGLDATTAINDTTLEKVADEAGAAHLLLREFQYMREQVEGTIAGIEGTLVSRARMLNVSWARIGEALKMTPQGIHKRAQDRNYVVEPHESFRY